MDIKFKRAFTLIELLVVVAIIGILASVVLASLTSARENARLAAGRQFEANVYHAEGDQAVGMWDFNECSGGTASDSTGNGGTASFTGGSGWSTTDTPTGTGCSGNFTGTNYLTAATVTTESAGISPFTISFWMKQTLIQNRASMASTANFPNGGWMVAEGYGSADARITFERSGSGTGYTITAPSNMPLNAWVNVVSVYDGATMFLYIDGKPIISGASGAAGTGQLALRIGSTQQGGWGNYTGLLDNVRVFNKSLSAFEISNLYAQGLKTREFAQK